MTSILREIVIDCTDTERVAAFWSAVLGWEVQREKEYAWMAAEPENPLAGMILVFQPVSEAKTVKNRVHIDVSPYRCEPAEEVERLLALGARHVDVGQGDVPWVVLADPEGNEFCVLGRRID